MHEDKVSKLWENFLLLDERDQDYLLGILKTLLYTERKKEVPAYFNLTSDQHLNDASKFIV